MAKIRTRAGKFKRYIAGGLLALVGFGGIKTYSNADEYATYLANETDIGNNFMNVRVEPIITETALGKINNALDEAKGDLGLELSRLTHGDEKIKEVVVKHTKNVIHEEFVDGNIVYNFVKEKPLHDTLEIQIIWEPRNSDVQGGILATVQWKYCGGVVGNPVINNEVAQKFGESVGNEVEKRVSEELKPEVIQKTANWAGYIILLVGIGIGGTVFYVKKIKK